MTTPDVELRLVIIITVNFNEHEVSFVNNKFVKLHSFLEADHHLRRITCGLIPYWNIRIMQGIFFP